MTPAAEEDWFVQYFVEGDRVSEAINFSTRRVACCVCSRFLNRSLSFDILFSYAGRHHGNEIVSVGGLRRGAKDTEHFVFYFLCFALMSDCFSSLVGEVSELRG